MHKYILSVFSRQSAAIATEVLCCAALVGPLSAQTCPLSYGSTDSAKSHKLYLYFPTADDATFPNYTTNASPARTFDVAGLNPAIGTTTALIDRIHDVVSDDYCEFNVQVLAATTNPATLAMPPAPPRNGRRGIGCERQRLGTSAGGGHERYH